MVDLSSYLEENIRTHESYKFHLNLFAEYVKFSAFDDAETQIDIKTFKQRLVWLN